MLQESNVYYSYYSFSDHKYVIQTELEEIALDGQQFSAPTPTISSSSSQKVDTSILEERIAMYMQASENASSAGDTSKKRRIDRGVKASVVLW